MQDNHGDITPRALFFLYVGIVLAVTFLQQEFVLLPQMRQLVDEADVETFVQQWQRWRWLAFPVGPLFLALQLFLVSGCLYLGSFFFPEMEGKPYKTWWAAATHGQAVMLLGSVINCILGLWLGTEGATGMSRHFSFAFLAPEGSDAWMMVPLSAVNVFEVVYWFVLAFSVSRLAGVRLSRALRFVMVSYGTGYLFYLAMAMFLLLYLA